MKKKKKIVKFSEQLSILYQQKIEMSYNIIVLVIFSCLFGFFFNLGWRLEKEGKQALTDLAPAVKEYNFASQAF